MLGHNVTDIDESILLGTVFAAGYALLLGSLAFCGSRLNSRLHDLTTEYSLDRRRQSEVMTRFMLFVEDALEPESPLDESQPQQEMLNGTDT